MMPSSSYDLRLKKALPAALIALLVVIPMVAVLLSFGFTPKAGSIYIWQDVLPDYALNSVFIMVVTLFFASVIGVSTAWLVTAFSFKGRMILSWMLVLPLAAPSYIIAYFYTDFLDFSGPLQTLGRSWFGLDADVRLLPSVRNMWGASILLALVLYPYVYLLARASFAQQSRSQFLAARSLGQGPLGAFRRVVLPGARPAIVGGLALVGMETLADFGVADYFAIPTLSTGIFRTWLALGDRIAALQLAGVMLLLVLLLVAIEAQTRKGRVDSDDPLLAQDPPFKLDRLGAGLAVAWCAIPILLGFVIPFAGLLSMALVEGDGIGVSQLLNYVGNSVLVAVITASLATIIATLLAYRQRRASQMEGKMVVSQRLIRVATLGYALPGAMLAIGVLWPLGYLDRSLAFFARDVLGVNMGLILSGTLTLLVYALLVRFLTVSFNSVSGGFSKIPITLDWAARSLGENQRGVVRRLHLPLLTPSLAAAMALVMIDVMRELPATLILRPFNFETLATRVYRLAGDERLAEASTAALIIMILGLIPVMGLTRLVKPRKG